MTNEERSGILGAVQPPPKLLIERLTDGDVTCLRLAGTIDEQFDAPGLALTITSKYVLLDLGGVDRISSFGIRQWVDFIAAIGPRLAGIYYVECSPKVVDQFNMVANFGGPGYSVSFYAPYRCDTCEQERRLLFRTDEANLSLAESGRPWAFDAPGDAFKLAAEAYRIGFVHELAPAEELPHEPLLARERQVGRRRRGGGVGRAGDGRDGVRRPLRDVVHAGLEHRGGDAAVPVGAGGGVGAAARTALPARLTSASRSAAA